MNHPKLDGSTMPSQKPVDGVERKKTILIYSPDLNFCFSLSMLFQDRYNVVTTTNIGMLETSVKNYDSDLAIIDAVPSDGLIGRIDRLKDASGGIPVILLYVYNAKETVLDKSIRTHVDCVFYKPFEIGTVSKRIEEFLSV